LHNSVCFPDLPFFSNSLPDNDYRALSRLNAAARIIKIVTRLAGKSGLAIAIDSLAFSFPLTGKPWRCSRGIRRATTGIVPAVPADPYRNQGNVFFVRFR